MRFFILQVLHIHYKIIKHNEYSIILGLNEFDIGIVFILHMITEIENRLFVYIMNV